MTQEHEEALHRLAEIIRIINTGDALSTRSALRDRSRGMAIIDLASAGRYDDAVAVATGGAAVVNPFATLNKASEGLSDEARRARSDTRSPFDAVEIITPLAYPPRTGLKKTTRVRRRQPDGGQ